MVKLFIIFTLILSTLYAKTKIEKENGLFVISQKGLEIIITYPTRVLKGTSIEIEANMNNSLIDAKSGGLSISFPQIKRVKAFIEENSFDKISIYMPPDKIYHRLKRRNIVSKSLMVEGWEESWKRGILKWFIFKMDLPKGINKLILYIRGTITLNNGKVIKIPERGTVIDQQGFFVEKVIIPLVKL